MILVNIEATIDRPIQNVFDRLVDIAGYEQWMPERGLFLGCSQDSAGPIGEGTRYTDRTRFGAVKGEILKFDPPTSVVFHYKARLLGRTVMEGWPAYELDPETDVRTRVRHRAEGRLYGLWRILEPLVRRLAQGERRRTVDALKESLEAT